MQCNKEGSNAYNKIYLASPISLMAEYKYCITLHVTKYLYNVLPFNPLLLDTDNDTLLNSSFEEKFAASYLPFEVTNLFNGRTDLNIEKKIKQ